jgi:glutamyl-tRNA synthetase
LHEKGLVYPCFCSPEELKLSRKIQRSSGLPPRYSGKCAHLTPEEVEQKRKENPNPTLRFRVPNDDIVEFEDLVRGKQSYKTSEIGDFIIRKGDGSAAFFFCNAIDDALMGVTHVLRGEDHLTNTPRQKMILDALNLELPQYGHISMIVGHDGSPLSKRHGSRSIRELREHGYLPVAVVNYLARLGHKFDSDDLLPVTELARGFKFEKLGRAPAKYDAHQLLHWQHQAIAAASIDELWDWMGADVHDLVANGYKKEFVTLVRANISFPEQAVHWAKILYHDPLNLDDDCREIVADAGTQFFEQAMLANELHPADHKAFMNEIKKNTGAKGKGLFMPLRAALTGELGGPELGGIMEILGPEKIKQRLHACLHF